MAPFSLSSIAPAITTVLFWPVLARTTVDGRL